MNPLGRQLVHFSGLPTIRPCDSIQVDASFKLLELHRKQSGKASQGGRSLTATGRSDVENDAMFSYMPYGRRFVPQVHTNVPDEFFEAQSMQKRFPQFNPRLVPETNLGLNRGKQ